MSSKTSQLRKILEKLYGKYNHRVLIAPDPLQFVYKFKSRQDREIAALLSASLAYGNVRQIERDLNKLFSITGKSPYEFATSFNQAKRGKLKVFKHRFTKGSDIADLFEVLKIILQKYSSIEKFFKEGYRSKDENIIPALTSFCERAYGLYEKRFGYAATDGFQYLITNPAKGSVCKRMNMFLRWMVRKDDVDPGLLRAIDKSKLIVPVDVHMARLCKILGLYQRKTLTIKTAVEITDSFRRICPADPVRYDFSLSRIGIVENCTGKFRSRCKDCELFPYCKT